MSVVQTISLPDELHTLLKNRVSDVPEGGNMSKLIAYLINLGLSRERELREKIEGKAKNGD